MMKHFLFFFIFINLISCTLIGPDYKRPEINLPNTYHQESNKENAVTDLIIGGSYMKILCLMN